jgi:hypothetical protein
MTDAQKVEALAQLLDMVIFNLEFVRFDVKNFKDSAHIQTQADKYRERLNQILNG